MALRFQKVICLFKPNAIRLAALEPSTLCAPAALKSVQVANLTTSHGEPAERHTPWPYKTRPYNMWYQFIDHTRKRFDDNTKVIVIDGNLAVGKSAFGEKLAKEFDMKFFPDVKDTGIYVTPGGFDIRELDEQLPPGARTCDLSTFYTHSAPKRQLERIGMTQMNMYHSRFYNYVSALEHLLNTGQGVVIERSPWSDVAFADVLRKFNFMTPKGYDFYNLVTLNTVCELWQPHLVIYLDAPINYIRDAINKRTIPWEAKSKVLSNEYLQALESVYKKKLLPLYRKYGEVVTYDVTDMIDWEIIVEELESLDLDETPDDQPDKFVRWNLEREDDWNCYRMFLACKWQMAGMFNFPLPFDAPEMFITGDDYEPWEKIVASHSELLYSPGFNPDKGSTLFRI